MMIRASWMLSVESKLLKKGECGCSSSIRLRRSRAAASLSCREEKCWSWTRPSFSSASRILVAKERVYSVVDARIRFSSDSSNSSAKSRAAGLSWRL